ncbi:methyltransferase domain-containing protein [Mycena amicta]|nr:methyltransferase domain-containing protein [Mycena amicta]
MAVSWTRNPRNVALIVAAIICLYIFWPSSDSPAPPHHGMREDDDLPNRIARSERIYNKLLVDRKVSSTRPQLRLVTSVQALIKKFGPTPNDVALFPPDKDPWPAYTVHDFFAPAFNCPHEVTRLGALGDGGKWVCGISRVEDKPDCIVYSFGINYESSFEAEILASTDHCIIYGYDFSVNSFGPEIRSQAHRTVFNAFGLAGTDKHGPEDSPKMYTLESLMKMNGHTHIDILKIDIERWEFETLTALVKPYIASGKPLPFGQLQLEIHIWNLTFAEYLAWWESLEAAGLRPFWTEPNLVYQNYNRGGTSDLAEYSFLNTKGDNIFIKNPKRHLEHGENRHVAGPTP